MKFEVLSSHGDVIQVTFTRKYFAFGDHFDFRGQITSTGYRSHFTNLADEVDPEYAAQKIVNAIIKEQDSEEAARCRKVRKIPDGFKVGDIVINVGKYHARKAGVVIGSEGSCLFVRYYGMRYSEKVWSKDLAVKDEAQLQLF